MSVSTPPTSEQIGQLVDAALQMHSDARPRTQQSRAGFLGPSDLGFCRAQAVLKTRGVLPSDTRSTRAADIGTAVHVWVEEAVKAAYPTWLTEEVKVTATFNYGPRTFTLTGTPDIIVPEWNMILDIKSVDGLSWVKRNGASQNHRFQRYTYAKGAAEQGLLDPDQPLFVANLYVDRSGREPQVYVGDIEECNPFLDDEIGQWLEDVVYAVEQRQDGNRDIAPEVCAQICEYFTVCRGTLPDERAESITDPGLVDAARMYHDASLAEKQARRTKDEAKAMLSGVSGIAGTLQVRWTKVGGSNIPGYFRTPYEKIAVTPVAVPRSAPED